jgi:hypothetical protein
LNRHSLKKTQYRIIILFDFIIRIYNISQFLDFILCWLFKCHKFFILIITLWIIFLVIFLNKDALNLFNVTIIFLLNLLKLKKVYKFFKLCEGCLILYIQSILKRSDVSLFKFDLLICKIIRLKIRKIFGIDQPRRISILIKINIIDFLITIHRLIFIFITHHRDFISIHNWLANLLLVWNCLQIVLFLLLIALHNKSISFT